MARNKQQTRKSPALLIALGVLLLLAAVVAFALQNMAKPSPAAVVPTPDETAIAGIERVTLTDAKAAFDAGQAVFVDVRGAGAYQVARVPGAVLIPLNEMETRLGELDPNDWIITYCT